MKIVVIEALGLHLGYLGCYGNDWVGTPNLDRLAAEGVVGDWHYVDQPEVPSLTPWARRSIATGRYALPGIAAVEANRELPLPTVVRCESLENFAGQVLKAAEEDPAWLWIEGPNLLPPWNMDDDLLAGYFDEDDVEEGLAPWKDPPTGLAKLSEAELLELQNTYAGVMTFFDAHIGAIVEGLKQKHRYSDLLLCVTAKAGQPLGEHDMIGVPRPSLHDEVVHVPLLLRLPGEAEAGRRLTALTQPIDLLPTFLEALSGEPVRADSFHGHSLWPLLRGEVEQVRPYAVSAMRIGDQESRLLRTQDWALHVQCASVGKEVSPLRLFAKPEDHWEVNDLHQQQMEWAEQMEKTLHAFAEAVQQPGSLAYPPLREE